MTDNSVGKNKVLSLVLVVVLVSLAGCIGPVDDITGILGSDDNVDGEDPIDAVPQESNFVMKVDPIGFAEDPTTREIGNYALSNFSQTNQSFSSQLNSSFEQFNNQIQEDLADEDVDVELRAQDLGEVVFFGDTEQLQTEGSGLQGVQSGPTTLQQQPPNPTQNISNQYFGVVVELNLTESELTELFNATEGSDNATDATFQQEQYNGRPVFTVEEDGQSVSLAILETGVHTFGPTDVVEDAVDTYVGDAEGVNESIVPEDGDNTYLSVGSTDVNQNLTGVSDQIDALDEDPSVESVLFTYSTNGDDTIELSSDLTLDSTQAAFQLQLEGQDGVEQIQEAPENQTGQFGLVEPVLSEDNINIGSDGATLKVDYEVTTSELKDFIDELQESQLGSTPTQPDQPVVSTPQISLSTEVTGADSDNPTVQITVDENENVQELRVSEQLGNNTRTFDDPQVGDVYEFEASPQSNVEIYGTTEEGRESFVDFVFVE